MAIEGTVEKMNLWKVTEIRYCEILGAEEMNQVQNGKSLEPRRFIHELCIHAIYNTDAYSTRDWLNRIINYKLWKWEIEIFI